LAIIQKTSPIVKPFSEIFGKYFFGRSCVNFLTEKIEICPGPCYTLGKKTSYGNLVSSLTANTERGRNPREGHWEALHFERDRSGTWRQGVFSAGTGKHVGQKCRVCL